MSSVKYNIKRKMEWMGRRLRYIDGSEEIKEWSAAISALNDVFKELDFKGSSDNWRPWKRPMEVGTDDLRKTGTQSREGTLVTKKCTVSEMEMRITPIISHDRPPSGQVEREDEDMCDPKAAVMKMLNTPQIEALRDSLDSEGDEIIRHGVVNTNRGGGDNIGNKVLDESTGEDRRRGGSVAKEKIQMWWRAARRTKSRNTGLATKTLRAS